MMRTFICNGVMIFHYGGSVSGVLFYYEWNIINNKNKKTDFICRLNFADTQVLCHQVYLVAVVDISVSPATPRLQFHRQGGKIL